MAAETPGAVLHGGGVTTETLSVHTAIERAGADLAATQGGASVSYLVHLQRNGKEPIFYNSFSE
jgi:hypothetical protein